MSVDSGPSSPVSAFQVQGCSQDTTCEGRGSSAAASGTSSPGPAPRVSSGTGLLQPLIFPMEQEAVTAFQAS